MVDIANHRSINLPAAQRDHVSLSSKLYSDVSSLLKAFVRSSKTYESICDENLPRNVAISNIVSSLIENVTKFYKIIGFEEKSKAVIAKGKLIGNILVRNQ